MVFLCPERPGVERRFDPSTTRTHKELLRIQELTADEINHLLDAVAVFKGIGGRHKKPPVSSVLYHTEAAAERHDADDLRGGFCNVIIDNYSCHVGKERLVSGVARSLKPNQ